MRTATPLFWIAGWIVCIAAGSWRATPQMVEAATHAFGARNQPVPSSPWRVTHQQVTVEVQIIDAEETKDIFDADLLRKDVQPLLVKIQNHSERVYHFAKSRVDPAYLPAAKAAEQAYDNPVLVGGKVVSRTFLSLPRRLLASKTDEAPRPLLNRDVQASFLREEIADRSIDPKGVLAGFMYVRPLPQRTRITLILLDAATQAPLVFEFPAAP